MPNKEIILLLDCLWYSKQHGQLPGELPKYRTGVHYNGKFYYYSDEPDEVKRVWNAHENYNWHQSDHIDRTTFLNAKTKMNKQTRVWVLAAIVCAVTFFVTLFLAKRVFTPITMFLVFFICIDNIKKNMLERSIDPGQFCLEEPKKAENTD